MADSRVITIRPTDVVHSAPAKSTPRERRLSRRGAITALAGTVALSPAIATAASEAEPLERLWLDYLDLKSRWLQAYRAAGVANEQSTAQHPARPISLFRRVRRNSADDGVQPLGRLDILEEIDRSRRVWPSRQGQERAGRWALKLRLLDKWEAACAAVDAANGIPELERADEVAMTKMNAAMALVFATPPRTPRGALVQMKALHEYASHNKDGDFYEFVIEPARVIELIRAFEKVV